MSTIVPMVAQVVVNGPHLTIRCGMKSSSLETKQQILKCFSLTNNYFEIKSIFILRKDIENGKQIPMIYDVIRDSNASAVKMSDISDKASDCHYSADTPPDSPGIRVLNAVINARIV